MNGSKYFFIRSDGLLQFIQMSEDEPLESQGPFDLILHKSSFLFKTDKRKYIDFEVWLTNS